MATDTSSRSSSTSELGASSPATGGAIVLAPVILLAIFPVFALTILITRISSLGSLSASLIGGLAIPVESLGIVLQHPLALTIHIAKAVLRVCITLVRGLPVPAKGLGVVLRNTLALTVHIAEGGFGVGVSVLCARAADLRGRSELPFNRILFVNRPEDRHGEGQLVGHRAKALLQPRLEQRPPHNAEQRQGRKNMNDQIQDVIPPHVITAERVVDGEG